MTIRIIIGSPVQCCYKWLDETVSSHLIHEFVSVIFLRVSRIIDSCLRDVVNAIQGNQSNDELDRLIGTSDLYRFFR